MGNNYSSKLVIQSSKILNNVIIQFNNKIKCIINNKLYNIKIKQKLLIIRIYNYNKIKKIFNKKSMSYRRYI